MTQEITKKLMCILMRESVEIWEEEEKLKSLMSFMEKQSSHKFIRINDNFINTADIAGIFTAQIMEDRTHRKNGQWQGKDSIWHNKGEYECGICGQILPKDKSCGNH